MRSLIPCSDHAGETARVMLIDCCIDAFCFSEVACKLKNFPLPACSRARLVSPPQTLTVLPSEVST